MSNHKLTAENMLAQLPAVLRNDPRLLALGSSIAGVLEQRAGEIQRISIYSCIDQLPEELLDILAYDFKVDWWDPEYTLDEKRATLKSSWHVHRKLGTPAAVVDAISAIYPDTQIAEWWEYGGEPYHFRLMINSTFEGIDQQRHERVMSRVRYYKNLRSVLDDVEYYDAGGTAVAYGMAACVGCSIVDGATAVRY